jgi:hypothetical protein
MVQPVFRGRIEEIVIGRTRNAEHPCRTPLKMQSEPQGALPNSVAVRAFAARKGHFSAGMVQMGADCSYRTWFAV